MKHRSPAVRRVRVGPSPGTLIETRAGKLIRLGTNTQGREPYSPTEVRIERTMTSITSLTPAQIAALPTASISA